PHRGAPAGRAGGLHHRHPRPRGEAGRDGGALAGLRTGALPPRREELDRAGGAGPTLTKVVAVLCARRRALEAGKLPALAALAGQTRDQVAADPALALLLAVRDR